MIGSMRAYARHREKRGLDGASLAAVQKAILNGRIKPLKDGRIDFEKADREWTRNTKPRTPVQAASRGSKRKPAQAKDSPAPGKGKRDEESDGKAPDFLVARTKTEIARAELLEMQAARERGELLPKDEVEQTWSAEISAARNRLLLIPSKLAPKLLDQTDVREVQAMIEGAIKEALASMSAEE